MRFQFQLRGVPLVSYAVFRMGLAAFVFQCDFVGRSIGAGCLGRFGFICVPSTLPGYADERAFHLLLNALNGPAA